MAMTYYSTTALKSLQGIEPLFCVQLTFQHASYYNITTTRFFCLGIHCYWWITNRFQYLPDSIIESDLETRLNILSLVPRLPGLFNVARVKLIFQHATLKNLEIGPGDEAKTYYTAVDQFEGKGPLTGG